MAESAEEIYRRALAAAGADGRLQLPPLDEWDTFPFEGELRVKSLLAPESTEPPRRGESSADCQACSSGDARAIWSDARWILVPPDAPSGLPVVLVLEHPDLRFFAVGGNLTSTLKVEVIYKTVLGTVTQPVTVVPTMGAWGSTLQAALLANVTGLLSLDGLTSSVQLRFTALGNAGWKIDDVYIDPWKTT